MTEERRREAGKAKEKKMKKEERERGEGVGGQKYGVRDKEKERRTKGNKKKEWGEEWKRGRRCGRLRRKDEKERDSCSIS